MLGTALPLRQSRSGAGPQHRKCRRPVVSGLLAGIRSGASGSSQPV